MHERKLKREKKEKEERAHSTDAGYINVHTLSERNGFDKYKCTQTTKGPMTYATDSHQLQTLDTSIANCSK